MERPLAPGAVVLWPRIDATGVADAMIEACMQYKMYHG
jgi:hypothetical protein